LPNKKFLANLPSQLTWSNLIFKICKWQDWFNKFAFVQ
jgi:hypothetical protein